MQIVASSYVGIDCASGLHLTRLLKSQERDQFVVWGKPETMLSRHTISAQKSILSISKKSFCASFDKLMMVSAQAQMHRLPGNGRPKNSETN